MRDALLNNLVGIVAATTSQGGQVSASIYDTAQCLRFMEDAPCPPATLDWLLSQQQPDGGWGSLSMPLARSISTMASMLALIERDRRPIAQAAVAQGQRFLFELADQWPAGVPDDLPVGLELLLPALIEQLQAADIDGPWPTFDTLVAYGNRRRYALAERTLPTGSRHAHSWESFGRTPALELIDGVGSVSHNPAATAAWLRATAGSEYQHNLAYQQARKRAAAYLHACQQATDTGVPGVVPGVWPMPRFEQTFVLYALVAADLLNEPALRDVAEQQVRDMQGALGPRGVGLSDHFEVDGDDTAAALVILAEAGLYTDPACLNYFDAGDHFCAYPGELHSSTSLTARAVHALWATDQPFERYLDYLLRNQLPDGRWPGDKWHQSWLYTTAHVLIALSACELYEPVVRGGVAVLCAQHADGGWGTLEETAFAILGLRASAALLEQPELLAAMQRGQQWLLAHAGQLEALPPAWIGKELYTPTRIVQSMILSAALASTNVEHRRLARIVC